MNDYNFLVSFGYGKVYETAFLQTKELSYAGFYNLELDPNPVERIINRLAFTSKVRFKGQSIFARLSFYIRYKRFKKIFSGMNTPDNTPCLILSSIYRSWEEKGFFDYLRKRMPRIKLVYFLTDIIESSIHMKSITEGESKVDLIVSYDKNDADKYGLVYYPVPYSDIYNEYLNEIQQYDVCFIGAKKNRLPQILEVYNHLITLGLKCAFYIIGMNDKEDCIDGICYCDYISYERYLQIEAQSKCIVEIVQDNCVGNTFRVPESIFLGKKLVTNNKGLLDTKCYYPENMLYYKTISDIDRAFFDRSVKDYPEDIKTYLLPVSFFNNIESLI